MNKKIFILLSISSISLFAFSPFSYNKVDFHSEQKVSNEKTSSTPKSIMSNNRLPGGFNVTKMKLKFVSKLKSKGAPKDIIKCAENATTKNDILKCKKDFMRFQRSNR